jgi:hypothetical protein
LAQYRHPAAYALEVTDKPDAIALEYRRFLAELGVDVA